LLRALAIPTLVQAQGLFAPAASQRPRVIGFDGGSGEVWLDPAPSEVEKIRQRQAILRRQATEQRKSAQRPGETADGHRIHVVANIGSVADAARALEAGAEGVGLLRTEFLFLERTSAPTETEQVQVLSEIIGRMAPHPVVIRTLDIGGDKRVPYLHLPEEENPFLGVRALRLCLARMDLFSTQLRAILRAARGGECRIMFPMVADANDLDRALAVLRQAHLDLEKEKIAHAWPIPAGIMVEIPSAALLSGRLGEQAEFFSIGTNDLTQYALAADRANPSLASYQDPAHPAVLRLVREVVAGAQRYQRPVAVCGEAAADECTAAILIGLGVRELSVSAPAIPRIKAMLRRHPLSGLKELAERALDCENASAVRELAQTF
jgi:phosphocarrier protein FPr